MPLCECILDIRDHSIHSTTNKHCFNHRQLYDKGTLERSDGKDFDRTNRNEYGKGKIEGTTKKTDYYCAKLAGTEFDVAEDSRALRGYN